MTITNRVALPAGSASERTESLRSCRPTEKGPGPDHNGTSHALYRLDASIRVDGSHSRAVADIVEQKWRNAHPEEPIIRRHVGVDPIPARAWPTAVFAGRTPEDVRSDEQKAALAFAATLTDELAAADALLFAAPLYNFGVSQHFKAWVDMVITDPRMAAGAEPVLAGKPAVLVTVRGGSYRPGTPREGWDHATGWMRRILADVWQLDLNVVEAEFTLIGVNPALDQFKDLAHDVREEAEQHARCAGRQLGAAVASTAAARTAPHLQSPGTRPRSSVSAPQPPMTWRRVTSIFPQHGYRASHAGPGGCGRLSPPPRWQSRGYASPASGSPAHKAFPTRTSSAPGGLDSHRSSDRCQRCTSYQPTK